VADNFAISTCHEASDVQSGIFTHAGYASWHKEE